MKVIQMMQVLQQGGVPVQPPTPPNTNGQSGQPNGQNGISPEVLPNAQAGIQPPTPGLDTPNQAGPLVPSGSPRQPFNRETETL